MRSLVDTTEIANDLSIHVATVNGSGSQSANTVLLRAIFRMGVPVSGKNVFPSNIQGLPTWFDVRASGDGWTARRRDVDLLVEMNPDSARDDVLALRPGAAVLHDSALVLAPLRSDLVFYPLPVDALVQPLTGDAKVRRLLRNMAWVGAAARLLSIDLEEVEKAIGHVFSAKAKARDLNVAAARAGFEGAKALEKRDPFVIRRLQKTAGKILIDGNSAAALGALFGGVTVVAWYPITPSTSLVDALRDYLAKYRTGPDGKATFAVLQTEDEMAAAGAVLGAGWAGARAMTATSGPGLSLMSELAGLAYYAEIPAVIWDVQRVGPSTGLPTRTSQGDLLTAAFLSHGDTRHLLLFPATMAECFGMAGDALDLAERFQTPVFVMSDLDLGMNTWMSDPFPYPERPLDRGKVLDADGLARLNGFARYADPDGDGIGWRTLPGTDHPRASYFTRGTGHDETSAYTEDPVIFERNMARLERKLDGARARLPAPVLEGSGEAPVGILAIGSSDPAIREALALLQRERGFAADYLRVRGYPFAPAVREFIEQHERVYVIEQNRDAQLLSLLRLDLAPEVAARLRPIAHVTGVPLDARTVAEQLGSLEGR
jgi:2-oxoglutarate ferredoxin oxidoreductase subunit alpha